MVFWGLAFSLAFARPLEFKSADPKDLPAPAKAHYERYAPDAKKLNGDQLKVELAHVDLNGDGRIDACVSFGPHMYFYGAGAQIECYFDLPEKGYVEVVEVNAVPAQIDVPGTKTKGVLDITFTPRSTVTPPVWHWSGTRYETLPPGDGPKRKSHP